MAHDATTGDPHPPEYWILNPSSKKSRPSPRTQGVTEEGETFQKFGTQQLEFVSPVVYGTPYQGVVQKDVGESFKGFTTTIFPTSDLTTAFSQQFQSGMTGVQRTVSPEVAREMQTAKLESMGIPSWQFPDLTTLFPPASPNGNGEERCTLDDDKMGCGITELFGGEKCECPNWFGWEDIGKERGCKCEACKKGTGQCSDKVPQCDAWDLTCEGTGGLIKDPSSIWLWIKIILALIGIGVLLWLLRPLFGIAKNITEK